MKFLSHTHMHSPTTIDNHMYTTLCLIDMHTTIICSYKLMTSVCVWFEASTPVPIHCSEGLQRWQPHMQSSPTHTRCNNNKLATEYQHHHQPFLEHCLIITKDSACFLQLWNEDAVLILQLQNERKPEVMILNLAYSYTLKHNTHSQCTTQTNTKPAASAAHRRLHSPS